MIQLIFIACSFSLPLPMIVSSAKFCSLTFQFGVLIACYLSQPKTIILVIITI